MSVFLKRSFSFLIVFILIFNMPNYSRVQANAFAMPITATSFVEGISIGTGLTISAPVVGALLVAGVAGGLILTHPNEVRQFISGSYSYLNKVGCGIGQGIKDLGNGAVELTSSAKSSLRDYISSMKSNTSNINIPWVDGIDVSSNSTVWTNINIPFEKFMNREFELFKTGNHIVSNVEFVFRVNGYDPVYSLKTSGNKAQIYEYDGAIKTGWDTLRLPNFGNINIGLRNRGSFPTSVGVIENVGSFFPGSCVSGVPDSAPYYRNPSLEGTKSTVINIPKDLTYGDVMGKTYENVILNVSVNDVGSIPNKPSLDLSLPNDVALDFSPLKVNLKDKFPFCIPFDFVNSIKSLRATPMAPVWKINIPSNYLTGGCSFNIDFTIFSEWALIVRWGILICFNVSLILLTRRIIK